MRTLKLVLAYDGTAYAGWQVQPGQPTLQAALETAWHSLTGETVRVAASGRTDAGVHALGQVVSVDSQSQIPAAGLRAALNAHLPADIVVRSVADAAPGFHAIRDAVRKRYRYLLYDGAVRDVFARQYAWHVHGELNAAVMHEASQALIGRHDFRSFESHWPNKQTSVRTVFELSVERGRAGQGRGGAAEDARLTVPFAAPLLVLLSPVANEGNLIAIEIEADGFLYNMVRAIVGTLVEVGRGARPVTWPAEVLATQDRRAAGPTAPPQGLFLLRVDYEEPTTGRAGG
ncbi:MAG: tRNA pseudouridine synthase A [Pirellulales bacterium]|nr:tRNA pseudouridine synthase A [Pirellulales bacterium]